MEEALKYLKEKESEAIKFWHKVDQEKFAETMQEYADYYHKQQNQANGVQASEATAILPLVGRIVCPFCGGDGEQLQMDKHCQYCDKYW